ncbi:PREDICTED: fibroblast growth factor-binding protein 3 [Thamnophis sirtalis]|uniref:Fibroblast growth factor-binding protein 3 n=1 Tax=Thamnophis sirtalis TaxID=35019 RepID=A0A6I9YCY5_9SAUR|nr:PREDICTED: fibroblast growth factor-binding protein 3 [Thamnophis sirtalis]
MKLPQTFPLTLLFLSCLECNPSKKGRGTTGERERLPFPWAQSGQFSTRDKHLCNWQLISGERDTELQITCHPAEGEAQRCVYRGQPELCAAYGAKGHQFWKQILGKLRRKRHPCQDTSPLKSRLCSSKKDTPGAQLHLVQTLPSTEVPVATASVTQGSPEGKSRGKNLPALQRSPQAHRDMTVTNPAKNGALKKQKKGGKRKGNPNSSVVPTRPAHRKPTTTVVEVTARPTELNADVVDAYCEEKWHSLCNFFVNFWNG